MAKVSVIEAARAANAFRRENWPSAIGPMVLIVIGGALNALWQKSAPAAAGLAGLVEFAGMVMTYGALFRLAFASDHPDDPSFRPGRSGFQWRMLEWRLIALFLIALAILLAAVLVFGLIYAAAGGGLPNVAGAFPRPPAPVAVIAGILLACGLVYCELRLCLAAPATVDAGEIRFLRTWPLTRGAVWPIFRANLLVVAVVIGFSIIAVIAGTAAGAIAGAVASFAASGPAKLATITTLTNAGGALGGAVVHAFVGVPLAVGLGAFLYRTLRSPETSA